MYLHVIDEETEEVIRNLLRLHSLCKDVAVVDVWVNEKLSYEENNVAVYKKLNITLPYNLVIPLFRSYPMEMKSHVRTKTDMRMFRAGLFITGKM